MTVYAQGLPRAELRAQREKLRSILQAIPSFGSGIVKPPIIDASADAGGDEEKSPQEAISGLRVLRDAVKRDLEVTDKFLDDPKSATEPSPSTNAPYLISVWNEVLLAPQPVIGIWHTFSESGKTLLPRRRGRQGKEDGVKVDVVADGGKRWIRVNTVKNSRILAEFREIDSYLTDSDSEDGDSAADTPPTLAQTEFDNSVLRMGRSLLNAAKKNPVPGSEQIPAITMQLTRLNPSPANEREYDARIPQTIDELKSMGIDVRLGERDDVEVDEAQRWHRPPLPRHLQPSTKINLDLSILIALVSDIPHSALPTSPEDAEKRFTPSAQYLQWKKTRLSLYDPRSTIEDIARPSRALSNQAIQEMCRSLFEEMHNRFSQLGNVTENDVARYTIPAVEFWTTPEAKERCLKIVSKIGGPNEKRRAQALFPNSPLSFEDLEEQYWKGSRYPAGFIPLLPIRLLPSSEPNPLDEPPAQDEYGRSLSPFFSALAITCKDLLAQETMPDPRTLREPHGQAEEGRIQDAKKNVGEVTTLDEGDQEGHHSDEEIQRASVMKANPRLTTHTVQSILWGAVKGWTTLTANKTSVKATLREMKARRTLWERVQGEVVDPDSARPDVAALWMVDPRSLAEGMRSDYISAA